MDGKEKTKDFWKAFPHTFARRASRKKWEIYPHLRHISKKITPSLLRGGGRWIVTIPPRHGKSEFISKWVPTWYLDQFPDRKIILGSYAADFASKWGGQVKANCEQIPEVDVKLTQDTKAKSKFTTKEGGQMMTAGIGGPMTGEGAHLLIIDDPLKNWQDAMSEKIRESQKEWFRSVARTRLEPGASVIILMTRWHEDDLAGFCLAGMDEETQKKVGSDWNLINFPAIGEDEEDILGRKKGDALCPSRFTESDFEQIKMDVGPKVWASLYQQRPYIEGGNMVKREWLKWYRAFPQVDEKIIVADLTFKKTQNADFACIETWGRKNTDIFLLDQIRSRMDFPAQVEAILAMVARHPEAMGKYIEEAANGAAIIAVLKDKISGLIPIRPRTSKDARLSAVAPLYESGNVHYPVPELCPWVETNLSELLGFPNMKNDDTVDCATMALNQLGQMSSMVSRLEALTRR